MIRYTTPTIRIRVADVDLSAFDAIYVTISQMGTAV